MISEFFALFFEDLSLWFLLFLTVSFAIGLLTAWWARARPIGQLRSRTALLERENARLQQERDLAVERHTLLQSERDTLRGEIDDYREEAQQAREQMDTAIARRAALEGELRQSEQERQAAQDELSALKTAYSWLSDKVANERADAEEEAFEGPYLIDSAPDDYATGSAWAVLPDDEPVDFLKHPLFGTDPYEETLLKARAAVEQAHFYAPVPTEMLEEIPETVHATFEEELLGKPPRPTTRTLPPFVAPTDEERAELDAALAEASAWVEALPEN